LCGDGNGHGRLGESWSTISNAGNEGVNTGERRIPKVDRNNRGGWGRALCHRSARPAGIAVFDVFGSGGKGLLSVCWLGARTKD